MKTKINCKNFSFLLVLLFKRAGTVGGINAIK